MRTCALLLAGLLVLGVGCDRRSSGPSVSEYEQVRQQQAQKRGTGQAAPAARAPAGPQETKGEGGGLTVAEQGYVYDPTGKRDPFRSFVLDQAKETAEREERGPLEQFDLAQLSVVAVVWSVDKAKALVEDPSGRAYLVEEGTRIGKNEGEVVAINDNLVAVRETYVDYLGERTTKRIDLRIRQSEGG